MIADQSEPFISIIVPAYLEADTIVESIERMIGQFEEDFSGRFELIVVIDGNVDATAANLLRIEDSRLHVVEKPRNEGKGRALRDGFSLASAPTIAQLDADLDLHPRDVKVLYDILLGASSQAAVGSKFHPLSKVSYPALRRAQSHLYQFIIRMMFGLRLSDTQTGVKVFDRESLLSVLDSVGESGFVFDLDLLAAMSDSGYRLKEGPITLDYQYSSSLPPLGALVMLKHTVRVWRRAKKRRPHLRRRDSDH